MDDLAKRINKIKAIDNFFRKIKEVGIKYGTFSNKELEELIKEKERIQEERLNNERVI